jgi:hypothetical protein
MYRFFLFLFRKSNAVVVACPSGSEVRKIKLVFVFRVSSVLLRRRPLVDETRLVVVVFLNVFRKIFLFFLLSIQVVY